MRVSINLAFDVPDAEVLNMLAAFSEKTQSEIVAIALYRTFTPFCDQAERKALEEYIQLRRDGPIESSGLGRFTGG